MVERAGAGSHVQLVRRRESASEVSLGRFHRGRNAVAAREPGHDRRRERAARAMAVTGREAGSTIPPREPGPARSVQPVAAETAGTIPPGGQNPPGTRIEELPGGPGRGRRPCAREAIR